MTHHDMLKNSVIIAAHPDDELLWFGSILEKVDKVILVYEDYWPIPTIGQARAAVLDDYPRSDVISLKIPEAATHSCADLKTPQLSEYGIKLGFQAQLRDMKQHVKRIWGGSSAPSQGIHRHYKSNYTLIREKLQAVLTPDMNVFTHNPWGEYGHEDHLQVYRVVDDLRRQIGFKQWMSNYCTERALPLATTYFHNAQTDFVQLPVDKEYSAKVADVYRHHGCWTWAENWKWFPFELFTEAPHAQSEDEGPSHLLPLNIFRFAM